MARWLGATLLTLAVLSAAGMATASSTTTAGRPRGAVEDCSTTPGWGRRDDFTRRASLVVGPLAVRHARPMLGYAPTVGGNKVILSVRGGHRVTLQLPFRTRRDGLVFGPHRGGSVPARRIVTFIACRRGERTGLFDGWPVTSWVGFLLASSPRCIPLRVWVDDESKPRHAVIRFGVSSCD